MEIKALMQQKRYGARKFIAKFPKKNLGLCLADLSHTENRCHRLSGEKARQRDKVYRTVSTRENIE